MVYPVPGVNAPPVSPLEQKILDLMSTENGLYLVYVYEATLRDASIERTLQVTVDRAPLMYGDVQTRTQQISNMMEVGNILEDARIRNCSRRLTTLSKLRDIVDDVFVEQFATLLGDAGTPGQRKEVYDAAQQLVREHMRVELFPEAKPFGQSNEFQAATPTVPQKPDIAAMRARRDLEQGLLKQLQAIKGGSLGTQAGLLQIASFEEGFFKALRKAAGLGEGIGA